MTEADWLTATDPTPMLAFLHDRAGDRKLQLFVCECCRRICHLLADNHDREVITVLERFADGLAGPSELQVAADRSTNEAIQQAARVLARAAAFHASAVAAGMIAAAAGDYDHPKGLGDSLAA